MRGAAGAEHTVRRAANEPYWAQLYSPNGSGEGPESTRPCRSSLSSRRAGSGSASGRWSALSPISPNQGVTVEANPVPWPRGRQPGGRGHSMILSTSRACWRLWRRPGLISLNIPPVSHQTGRFHMEPEVPPNGIRGKEKRVPSFDAPLPRPLALQRLTRSRPPSNDPTRLPA
jgi:hypothetical protein